MKILVQKKTQAARDCVFKEGGLSATFLRTCVRVQKGDLLRYGSGE